MLLLEQGHIDHGLFEGARLCLPDGWPVARMASRRSGSEVGRVAGSDLFEALLSSPGRGRPMMLVGGTSPESIEPVLRRAREAGWVPHHDPAPASALADPDLRAQVKRSALQLGQNGVVVLGVGAPKQERLAQEMVASGGRGVILCLGMSINFSSGAARRAGPRVQKLKSEWLHRLLTEPRRLGPRYYEDAKFYVRFKRENARSSP